LVVEFWPYGMKRVDSFGLMKAALAHYSGFHNLRQNPYRFHRIGDLDTLYAELDEAGERGEDGYTNILIIPTAGAAFSQC
jgi:hypothetical protein